MAVRPMTAADPATLGPGPDSAVRNSDRRPIRTCIGCRQREAAAELLRVVAVPGPVVSVVPDPRRRAPGRGASVHPRSECLDLAERRRAFGRALRVDGPIDTGAVRQYIEQTGTPTSGTPQE